MNDLTEKYIDHEVRIRMLDASFHDMKEAIKNLNSKIDKKFEILTKTLVQIGGGIAVAVVIPIVLHYLGLI